MVAAGIGHRYFFNKNIHIKTTLTTTANGLDMVTDRMNSLDKKLLPQNVIKNTTGNIILSSYINTKFSAKHTNKTGITATGMFYNLLLKEAKPQGVPLATIVNEKGNSMLLNAYSSSSFRLSSALQLNAGINAQWFTLDDHYSIEPRLGLKYQLSNSHSLALAYGLHSRLERLNYYFTRPSAGNELHNKDLNFTKAHHFVLGYDWNVSGNMHIKIEPYYQQLFNVPVIADSSYSFINLENDWFLNKKLENTGKGRNVGIDITVEKYLTNGFYYLASASLFDSKYKGGDGVWRNTRFNRNYLFNVLGGKEWYAGKENKNVLGLNLRISYQGGDHYIPVNEVASVEQQDVVYDAAHAFEKSTDPMLFTHLTFSYKKNKKRSSHEWSLKIINATNQKEFYGFRYNFIRQGVDINREALIVPNLSYKIEF